MEYMANLIPELGRMGVRVSDSRKISFGVQLRLQRHDTEVVLNIYHSEKKGLSAVIGGDVKSVLGQEVIKKTAELKGKKEDIALHHWHNWIGSDECGKGDYFGALVGCAVAVDETMKPHLTGMGVMDSKLLTDRQIMAVARDLYRRYSDRINCLVLKPLKYNEIYTAMWHQGKNLNDLLTWLHYTLIRGLVVRSMGENPVLPKPDGILVDQFSSLCKVQKLCQRKDLGIPVVERHHAESDLAVAAASIIARYQFLQTHQEMCKYYQIEFPKGASKLVAKTLRQFVENYSAKRLNEVVKLHFKTTVKYLSDEEANQLFLNASDWT